MGDADMAEDNVKTIDAQAEETPDAPAAKTAPDQKPNINTTKKTMPTAGTGGPVAIAKAQKVSPFKKAGTGINTAKKPVAAGSAVKRPVAAGSAVKRPVAAGSAAKPSTPAQPQNRPMPSGKAPGSPFATTLLIMTLLLITLSVFILYLNTATNTSMAGIRDMVNNLAQGSDNALSLWPEQNDLVAQETKTLIEQNTGSIDSAKEIISKTEKLLAREQE